MAKEKKHLTSIDEVDRTNKDELSTVYVATKETNAQKRDRTVRSRRVIPGRIEVKNDLEGRGIITEHPPQIAGTLHHLDVSNRAASMNCQFNGEHNVGGKNNTNCPMPATDIIHDNSRPRSSAIGLCKMHSSQIQSEGVRHGADLDVMKAYSRNIRDLKKVQAQEAERSNLKAAGGLYLEGSVPMDDALLFNMGKQPGGQKQNKFGGGAKIAPGLGAPLMNEEESAQYYNERLEERKGKAPTEYQLNSKPIEVKMGNKGPKLDENQPLGEGTGDIDHVLRLYRDNDASWSNEATRLGIHEGQLQPQNVAGPRVHKSDSDKLLFTVAKPRMQKALENVGEDQAEAVATASAQNTLAEKQRRQQGIRTSLPGTKKGRKELPMRRGTPLPGAPTQLPGRRKAFEDGTTPEIEPPK